MKGNYYFDKIASYYGNQYSPSRHDDTKFLLETQNTYLSLELKGWIGLM